MFTVGIITASDKGAKGERIDKSGDLIHSIVEENGYAVKQRCLVPDEKEVLMNTMIDFADNYQLDLIITTGGTGFSQRDITPEATLEVIERETRGISEAIRYYGLQKTPRAMLSRAVSGIRGKSLIINLPGSPKGVKESLEAIIDTLKHGIAILKAEASECGRNE